MAANEPIATSLSLDQLEAVVQRFENAWLHGVQPNIEDFLPVDGANRRGLLIELIHIDLELRLKGGEPARVEKYLQRYPELARDSQVVIDLLVSEFDLRRRREPSLNQDEYRRRFPHLHKDLAGRLAPAPAPAARPATIHVDTVESLSMLLRQAPILEQQQVDELNQIQGRFTEPRGMARELIQRGWLTPFQINQLFQGKINELTLGPYVLLERIGEGGMGQVYKARHLLMKRLVAVKLIRKDRLADPESVRRFHREVRAVAQLQHPNIVMAFDAAQVGDVHFLAMEYVEGTDLNKLVKKSGPLPIAQACNYVRQAALGLQHAHERGLVHRDIKPANLLLSTARSVSNAQGIEAVVKVLDMGLARLHQGVGEQTAADLTAEGMVMGTPDYIAPEQAQDSSKADIRADIYSLGCTLYFLLTGQPPFPGGSLAQKLLRHQQAQPAPLTARRQDVPPALQAVLAQMMAKQPAERYQTPAEVALALEVYADVRPPVALPVTAAERQTITSRPPEALLVSSPAALASAPLAIRVTDPGEETTPHLAAAEANTDSRLPMARPARKRPRWLVPGLAVAGCVLVLMPLLLLLRGRLAKQPVARNEGVPWLKAVEVLAVLGEHRVMHLGNNRRIAALAVSHDGKRAATAGNWDNRVVLVDPETLGQAAEFPSLAVNMLRLSFSPDDTLLAGASVGSSDVYVWDVKQNKLIHTLKGHEAGVYALAFLPREKRLVTGGADKTIRIWDLNTGKEIDRFTEHKHGISALAATPDGKQIVSVDVGSDAGKPPTMLVWDVARKNEPRRLEGARSSIYDLQFSPDGQYLAGVGTGSILWNFSTGEVLSESLPGEVDGRVAFSPDGKYLVTGAGCLVEVATRRHLLTWPDVSPPVAFLPNGEALWACGSTLQKFNPPKKDLLRPYIGHHMPVIAVHFDRSGERLLSVAQDSQMLEWSVADAKVVKQTTLPGVPLNGVRFSADKSLLLVRCEGGGGHVAYHVYEPGGNRLLKTINGDGILDMGYFSSDKEVTTVHQDGKLRLWTLSEREPQVKADCGLDQLRGLTWSADGSKFLAWRDVDNARLVYDVKEGKQLRRWQSEASVRLVLSHDGRRAFAGKANGHIDVFDLSPEKIDKPLVELPRLHQVAVNGLYPSPDGKLLASVDASSHVVIWDTAKWDKVVEWDHKTPLNHLDWAPDSRRFAVANGNGTVYVLRVPDLK